jgi:hypothetical protein
VSSAQLSRTKSLQGICFLFGCGSSRLLSPSAFKQRLKSLDGIFAEYANADSFRNQTLPCGQPLVGH